MATLAQPLAAWGRGMLDLIYPPTCAVCDLRLHPSEQRLCDPCRAAMLTEDVWRCRRCGATGAGEGPRRGELCPFCPPPGAPHGGVLHATRYNAVAARCVQLFKYHRRIDMGMMLADVAVARLAEPLLALEERIECVVPVPLHWGRRITRGFNQSELLARRLAEGLGLPLREGLLRRIRHTARQVRLPPERREANVRGAFGVPRRFLGRLPGVLLVDDVVTSGSTITECARTLTAAGAPQVWVACVARARPRPTGAAVRPEEPGVQGENRSDA